MLPIFIMLQLLTLAPISSQQIFFQDFQSYNTGATLYIYLTFNGTWYRSDINKQTGQYKIRGPNAIPTKYLGIFVQSNSSITCVDLTLEVGSVYQLQFDHTWEIFSDVSLFVKWNGVTVFGFAGYGVGLLVSGYFVREVLELPVIGGVGNTLCFCGAHPMAGTRLGPVVDNVKVSLLRAASPSPPSPPPPLINSSSNTSTINLTNLTNISTSLNTTNSSTLIPVSPIPSPNPSPTPSPAPKNPLSSVELDWVKEFVVKFNLFLKFTGIFGFSYLISNLLNFWNIIVLYYFLQLQAYLGMYKIQLEKLCRISLEEGSILSLIEKSSNSPQMAMPNDHYQKIPTTVTEWPSFSQLGFSSQILPNNIESYLTLLNCIFKLFLIKIFMALIRRYKFCFSSFFYGVRVHYVEIFCYEAVSSMPGMIIPIGVMLSGYSAIAFGSFKEKINNLFQVLVLLMMEICLLLPLLTKKKSKPPPPPKKALPKSSIFVQSQHATLKSLELELENKLSNQTEIQMKTTSTCAKKTKKVIEEQEYAKKMLEYRKQIRFNQFLYWGWLIDVYDQLLFFTVPFFVGLRCNWVFFLGNFGVIGISLAVEKRKGYLRREFNPKEYWFGLTIKIIFLTVHLLFLILYFQDLSIFSLSITELALINLLTIIFILMGAFVQTIHTAVNFGIWAYEIWKKVRAVSEKNRIVDERQGYDERIGKTLKPIHARKDTEFKLNQKDSINQSVSPKEEVKIMTTRSIAFRKVGNKTRRLTKVEFVAKPDENQPQQ